MFSSFARSFNTPNRPESDLTKNSHRQPIPPKNDEQLRLSDFEIQTIHNEVDEDQNLDLTDLSMWVAVVGDDIGIVGDIGQGRNLCVSQAIALQKLLFVAGIGYGL